MFAKYMFFKKQVNYALVHIADCSQTITPEVCRATNSLRASQCLHSSRVALISAAGVRVYVVHAAHAICMTAVALLPFSAHFLKNDINSHIGASTGTTFTQG